MVLAFFSGVAAVGAVIAIFPVTESISGPNSNSDVSSPGTAATRRAVPLDEFLDRWGASISGTYVVVGTVTRSIGVGADRKVEESEHFRQARRD